MRLYDYKRYCVRAPRRLGVVRRAAARQALGEPARAPLPAGRAADARAGRGGPPRVALRVRLPEHDDRPAPGPGHRVADGAGREPARPATSGDASAHAKRGPADAPRAAPQHPRQQRRPRRGHRPRRGGPARDQDARLPPRAAGGQGGGGRLVRGPDPRRPRTRWPNEPAAAARPGAGAAHARAARARDDAPAARVHGRSRARLGAARVLRARVDLRSARLGGRRARRVGDARDRRPELLRHRAARTASRAPSTTSAGTAAHGSSRRSAAGPAPGSPAPITPGRTGSTASCSAPGRPRGSRTSTPPATGSRRCAPRSSAGW